MSEEVTKLALECLKTDLERLRLKAESDKLMMQSLVELTPLLYQFITALVESKGELSPEALMEITKGLRLPPGAILEFAKNISLEGLESLISDLQKILDERGEGAES